MKLINVSDGLYIRIRDDDTIEIETEWDNQFVTLDQDDWKAILAALELEKLALNMGANIERSK